LVPRLSKVGGRVARVLWWLRLYVDCTAACYLHESGFRQHVTSDVGKQPGRLFDRGPVEQLRWVGKRPVERVHVLAPVPKIVHVDVVLAHVVVVVHVGRVAARMVTDHL